jgi:hypothetical protein
VETLKITSCRHCERSEAIQLNDYLIFLDRHGAMRLAMTAFNMV